MREIRTSGSEGGGTSVLPTPIPLGGPGGHGWVPTAQDGAFVSLFGRRGASPLQVDVLRPVTESNCVVARRGGKQLEVNDQSVTVVNSIRPGCLASLPSYGEAQTSRETASVNIDLAGT